MVVQEEVDQESASSSTLSVVEALTDIPTSPESESHEEEGPSLRIKLNHPPEVIVGNMNELTQRKRIVDKCVANFVSYSCYLSQFELTIGLLGKSVDYALYRSMIGSLLYLTTSRLDISYSVGVCANIRQTLKSLI